MDGERFTDSNPMKRKLLSFLIQGAIYAATAAAFYLLFFRSQF